MKKVILVITLLSLFAPAISNADGMILPRPDYYMNETGQKAVIFYENGTETLVLSTSFSGDASDFAWVIPVPAKPQVSKGSDEIFTSLAEIVRPGIEGIMMEAAAGYKGADTMTSRVTIVETKKVDYYDITVLQATDPEALTKWLNENNYRYPEESSYILNDYVQNQWYFIAVKIDSSAVNSSEVQQGLKEGHTTPLKIEFAAQAIIYPLRISSITTKPEVIQLSENLFLDKSRIDHLNAIGYLDLTVKANDAASSSNAIISQIINDLAASVVYENSVAAKYPLIISKLGYDAQLSYRQFVNEQQAGIVRSGGNNYQDIVEAWFNNYFNQQGLYFNDYSYRTVPIHLYVIASHKNDLPGFETSYANIIKKNQIENLAYDLNGKPLLKPQNNKYWLTYFYGNKDTNQMTSDLVIRDASDNKKVGPAESDVLTFSWLKLILIYFIALIVWIFSPMGLVFAGFSLLQFFSKSRPARIVAWVFQILSLATTFLIFSFLSFVMAREKSYYIMSVRAYPSSIFNNYLLLAFLLAGLTVLIGCLIVIIFQVRRHCKIADGDSGAVNAAVETINIEPDKPAVKLESNKKIKKEKNNLPKPKKIVMLVW